MIVGDHWLPLFDRILMVCVGNICRSPMAEALLAHRVAEKGAKAVVHSAGLAALEGKPADAHAQSLMRARGIDLSRHRARQVTGDMVKEADLVLVMEREHQRVLEAKMPYARGKVHRLGRWADFDVPDPYGLGPRAFMEALALIERGVDALERRIWG